MTVTGYRLTGSDSSLEHDTTSTLESKIISRYSSSSSRVLSTLRAEKGCRGSWPVACGLWLVALGIGRVKRDWRSETCWYLGS